MLRDRFAGPHTPPTATGKAWTAVTFRTNITDLLLQLTESAARPRHIQALALRRASTKDTHKKSCHYLGLEGLLPKTQAVVQLMKMSRGNHMWRALLRGVLLTMPPLLLQGAAVAQERGDPQAGFALARQSCSECHVVGNDLGPDRRAASFVTIAMTQTGALRLPSNLPSQRAQYPA